MSPPADHSAAGHPGDGRLVARPADVARDLALGLVPLLSVAGAGWALLGLPGFVVWLAVALYGALGALVLARVDGSAAARTPAPSSRDGSRPPVGLGPANRVSLLRAAIFLPLVPLALVPDRLEGAVCWWIIAIATVALVLDGVDGAIARRTDQSSAFGARLDMELDAFVLLALSVLVWRSGTVGPWVLAIGAMRYLFVAAGVMWPVLRQELPPSRWRKAVCVMQGVVLLVALGPIVPAILANLVVAGGLALLVQSFSADVAWLIGRRQNDTGRISERRVS